MSTATEFLVTGMTCGHCEMSIREEVSEVAGVTDISVNSATGKLTVTHDTQIADAGLIAAIIAAVDEAGYAATRA